jgi:hypothetical protein
MGRGYNSPVLPQQTRISAPSKKQTRLYHFFFGDPACFFMISCYGMTVRTGLTRRNRIAISGVVSGQSSS